MVKVINSRIELRSVLQQAKFFTFDQDGKCFTYRYSEKLCKVIKLSNKLQGRVHDKLGPWFNGPKFLYVFESMTSVRKFIEVNLPRYEENILDPDSNEMAYTLLMATASADLIIQYDFKYMRIYLNHKEKGAVPEFKSFTSIKACLDEMLLVINNFKNKE